MDCCTETLKLGRVNGYTVYHTCVVKNCEVFCSGSNMYGQLGDQTGKNSDILVKVNGLSGRTLAVEVSANNGGIGRSCSMQHNNDVLCWGYMNETLFHTKPVRITENAKGFSNGQTDVCFVSNKNEAMCIGNTKTDHLANKNVESVWLLDDDELYGTIGSSLIGKRNMYELEDTILQVYQSQQGDVCVLLSNGVLTCMEENEFAVIAQNVVDFSCGAHGCFYVDNEQNVWHAGEIVSDGDKVETSTYKTCVINGLSIECLGIETNSFSHDGTTFTTICSATAENCSPDYSTILYVSLIIFAVLFFCCSICIRKSKEKQVLFTAVPVQEEEIEYDIEEKERKNDDEIRLVLSQDNVNLMHMNPAEINDI